LKREAISAAIEEYVASGKVIIRAKDILDELQP
jgi:hypothetical protein